ncbi:MAG: phosphoribosylanthranilate isomerase [Phycisphaerales bacterium]|nr:phosphoribosylanthranilate isomerase [Phycisphaerales bacterium]
MEIRSGKLKTLVKICGLRTLDDAIRAAELGADAIGFVVAQASPRHVDFQTALEIANHILSHIHAQKTMPNPTGGVSGKAFQIRATPVLVMRSWSDVTNAQLQHWPGTIQVYEAIGGPNRKRIFGCSIEEANTLQHCPHELISALLIDAPNAGAGDDWNWCRPTQTWANRLPLILAGGLTPDQVAKAISQTQPWAVDVSSGVESSRGVKDFTKVRDFIEAARGAQSKVADSFPSASVTTFDQL